MGKRNQVGDIISGFSFRDMNASKIKDGRWTQGHEVDVEAKGEWLVVDAYLGGGGTGMGPHDIYPDAWHIVLQKLGAGDKVGYKSGNAWARKEFEYTPRNPVEVGFTRTGLRPQRAGRQITVTQDTNCYNNCIPYVEPMEHWEKVIEVKWLSKDE